MMKRLLLFVFLLCASPAWSAISFTSADGEGGGAGSISTLNFGFGGGNIGDIASICVSFTDATKSISSVTGDISGAVQVDRKCNGTAICVEQWRGTVTGSTPTITTNFSAATNVTGTVALYSGVVSIGATATATSGTGANASISMITQDANNFIVSCQGSNGNFEAVAVTGNLRASNNETGTPHSDSAVADNTVGSPGSVTVETTINDPGTGPWAATAFELRTASGATTRRPISPIIFE